MMPYAIARESYVEVGEAFAAFCAELVVDVVFSILQDKRSDVRNAVWWMPEHGEAIIAVGNLSNSAASATLTFSNGDSENVEVPALGTRLVRKRAEQSLSEIGKPSLPSLVKVISDYDPDSLESENALITVMLIFRDEPEGGVKYLKDAADKSTYPLDKQRLLVAAEKAKGPPALLDRPPSEAVVKAIPPRML